MSTLSSKLTSHCAVQNPCRYPRVFEGHIQKAARGATGGPKKWPQVLGNMAKLCIVQGFRFETQMSQDQQFCRPYQRRVVSSSHMFPLLCDLSSVLGRCGNPKPKRNDSWPNSLKILRHRLGSTAWTKLHLPDPPNTLEVNPKAFGSKLQEIQIESEIVQYLSVPCFWMVLPCRICRCRPRSSRRIGRLRSCAHANCRTFLGNQSSSCCWRSGNPMEPNGAQWSPMDPNGIWQSTKKVPFQWEEHVSWWFCQP